ncbi:tetratricopeptide repeat protein [Anthocerotibacter panamensis]|uniref:tetratricopeptide repeat protein n=1 Tax=Anthocerotibacter panamensis TaxID=2857077 RepID=UPI001C405865|nr:tetratricopeptide repeat protein [Anthocerotibacter panamensis]
MQPGKALDETFNELGIVAARVAKQTKGEVSASEISRFRNLRQDISSRKLQAILDVLPEDARTHFFRRAGGDELVSRLNEPFAIKSLILSNAPGKPRSIADLTCEIHLQRANAYLELNQYDAASSEFATALNILKDTGDFPLVEAQLYINMGNCASQLSQNEEARKFYHMGLRLSEIAYPTTTQTKGKGRKKTNELNKEQEEVQKLRARVLVNLSNLDFVAGHFDKVEQYCREVLDIAQRFKLDAIYGHCCENLGNISAIRGEWEAAIEYYLASTRTDFPMYKNYGLLNNLGFCYIHAGQYDEAERLIQRLLALAYNDEVKRYKASALFMLGLCAEFQRREKIALAYYQQSCAVHETPEALIGVVRVCNLASSPTFKVILEDAYKILCEQPFTPFTDYSLEWLTLIELQGELATEGAKRWVSQMAKCLPQTFMYWKLPQREKLLKLVSNGGHLD